MAKTPQEARQSTAMNAIALTVVVGRAGGILEIPIDEFESIVERYGGKGNATMFAELLEGALARSAFASRWSTRSPPMAI